MGDFQDVEFVVIRRILLRISTAVQRNHLCKQGQVAARQPGVLVYVAGNCSAKPGRMAELRCVATQACTTTFPTPTAACNTAGRALGRVVRPGEQSWDWFDVCSLHRSERH